MAQKGGVASEDNVLFAGSSMAFFRKENLIVDLSSRCSRVIQITCYSWLVESLVSSDAGDEE